MDNKLGNDGNNKIAKRDNGAFETLKMSLIGLGVVGGVTLLWWGVSSIPFVGWGISKLVTGVSKLVNFGAKNVGWGISKLVNFGAKKLMKAPGRENCYICRDAFESDPASYFRTL